MEWIKGLKEVAHKQGENIRQLEQQLKYKAQAKDLDVLSVSMSNKPTFVEMQKNIATRLEELNIPGLHAQLHTKADKHELKDLYEDMANATKRIGDSTNSLELLVRQQQSEIENLKAEVKRLVSMRSQDEEDQTRYATKKWVEENLSFESAARQQNITNLQRMIQERASELEAKVEEVPSVATLDEIFSAKVDLSTLTRVLQDRPTQAQISKEIVQRLDELAQTLMDHAASAAQEGDELTLAKARADVDKLQDAMSERVTRGELLEICGQKVGVEEFDDRLQRSTDTLASEVKEAIVGIQKELVDVLNRKAFKADVSKMIEPKASVEDVQAWLSSKVEVSDVRDSLTYKTDLTVTQELMNRLEALEDHLKRGRFPRSPRGAPAARHKQRGAGVRRRRRLDQYDQDDDDDGAARDSDFEDMGGDGGGGDDFFSDDGDIHSELELRHRLRMLGRRVRQLSSDKASVKDVCVLLDQKANIKDVNEALAKVSATEAARAAKENLVSEDDPVVASVKADIAQLADAVHAELSTGRWIWSCGRVLSDRAVPWNIECINTASDNFIWKQDSPDLITVVPGLYELQVGFFSERDPEVQILVNGEPIFFTSSGNRHDKRRTSLGGGAAGGGARQGSVLKRAKHSAGNITGWTANEFVALPGRARLTVLYEGESGTQGFLGVRKL